MFLNKGEWNKRSSEKPKRKLNNYEPKDIPLDLECKQGTAGIWKENRHNVLVIRLINAATTHQLKSKIQCQLWLCLL